MLVVVNVAEAPAAAPPPPASRRGGEERGCEVLSLCATVEAEIADLPASDQPEFLASLGLAEPVRARFIRAAYHLLDLISFFTVGEDEVRAWPIRRGDKAPRAAGRIHSDLERGFIRAEVDALRGLHVRRERGEGAPGGEAPARGQGVRRPRRRHHDHPVRGLTRSRPAPGTCVSHPGATKSISTRA